MVVEVVKKEKIPMGSEDVRIATSHENRPFPLLFLYDEKNLVLSTIDAAYRVCSN
jgi:hypothetical protein